jgi:orotidine-5'-phosphate decarboxylase
VAELVVAFDGPSGREALALAQRLPGLCWAKLGPVLYVREGPTLVREFAARGVRVFLDLKWHDIPSIVAGSVAAARELGVAMATVHCLGGAAMLAAAAQAAGEVALVGVTVLTSHDAAGLGQVLGRGVPDLACEAERLARLAVQAGLRGVVASGAELSLLREALGPAPWIVVPGIRSPPDPPDDQARTIAPQDAVRQGATHLVVGRPITRATDPAAAYQRLVECL